MSVLLDFDLSTIIFEFLNRNDLTILSFVNSFNSQINNYRNDLVFDTIINNFLIKFQNNAMKLTHWISLHKPYFTRKRLQMLRNDMTVLLQRKNINRLNYDRYRKQKHFLNQILYHLILKINNSDDVVKQKVSPILNMVQIYLNKEQLLILKKW